MSGPSARQLGSAAVDKHVSYLHEPVERTGLPDASVGLPAAVRAAHRFDLSVSLPHDRRNALPPRVTFRRLQ